MVHLWKRRSKGGAEVEASHHNRNQIIKTMMTNPLTLMAASRSSSLLQDSEMRTVSVQPTSTEVSSQLLSHTHQLDRWGSKTTIRTNCHPKTTMNTNSSSPMAKTSHSCSEAFHSRSNQPIYRCSSKIMHMYKAASSLAKIMKDDVQVTEQSYSKMRPNAWELWTRNRGRILATGMWNCI